MAHFFIDGSEVKLGGKLYFGWAVTGYVDGEYVEHRGSREVEKTAIGTCELYAFIKAIPYIKTYTKEDFLNTRIYVDDFNVAFGFHGILTRTYNQYVDSAINLIGRTPERLCNDCLDALIHGNVYKIKGHQGHVLQERADYLAKNLGTDRESFERWLFKGKRFWNSKIDNYDTKYYPFTNTLE